MNPARLSVTVLTVALGALALAVPTPAAAQDYYTDVRPILVDRCMKCHTEEGIAWSMEDPEEAFDRRRLIALMATSRKMPPWLAEPGHQEYVEDLSLDDDELEAIAAWRDAGFPRGEPGPDPEGEPDAHGAFEADLSLELIPGGSYTPDPSMDDEYRCFVVDWTEDEPGYVTGFRTMPGNLAVAHHTVIYAVEPGLVDRFRELEAGEEGAGYRCFGGALPDRLAEDAEREAYEARHPGGVEELDGATWWLAHWAPGMFGNAFPEGTGIRIEPGSGLVVQMHYYSGDAPGEADAGTRVDFRFAERVERPAFHLPQTGPGWLRAEANGSMVIPPGEKATYEATDGLGSLVGYAAAVTGVPEERIQALEMHSANLHMHAFGHSGEITLVHPDGRAETLLSVPEWDLHWQRDFTFAEPKVVTRDDLEDTSLRVQCTYHNPTEETVYGGYGSYDEMCFNFPYIAVREGVSSTEAAAPQQDRVPVVGQPCEGCEAVFVGMPGSLSSEARIAPEGEPGEPMVVRGTVYDLDGSPAPGVIVYAYQTDAGGVYPPDESFQGHARRHGRLRGWARTNAEGGYRFDTIRPGSYPSGDAPAHVHLHVIEPGCCTYWIDSIHFTDDPLLSDEEREPSGTARGGSGLVTPQREGEVWIVERDIHLGRAVPGYPDRLRRRESRD